jgi:hypothetical protein
VPTPDDGLEEFKQLTEVGELRGTVSKLQARLRRAETKTADLVQAAHDGAREAAVILGNPPPVSPPPKDRRRRAKEEVALLHLSDWQLGKVTETFNSEIARDRVRQVANKLVRLTEIERADHPVRECHNMLGGDFPEGTHIFKGQAFEIDSGLFKQTFNCVGAIEELARIELSVFERIHMWEVDGNHGRLGSYGEGPREDNADLFTYREARERLAEYERAGRIVWHPRERWYQIVVIGNYRALLVHGDQIKQFGGNLPAFGVARKVNAWAAGVVEPFIDVYLGHFHQPMVLPMAEGHRRAFMNPSLESGSTYAQEFVAAIGSPGQRLNFIEPQKGMVTSERIVWVN